MFSRLSVNFILILSCILSGCTKQDTNQETMTAAGKIAYAVAAPGSGTPSAMDI